MECITKINGLPIKDSEARTLINNEASSRTQQINDLKELIKGKQEAKSFNSISEMIAALNSASATDYVLGGNLLITESSVPDFWIGKINSSKATGTPEGLVAASYDNYQVGYYTIYQLETYINISGIAINAAEIQKLKTWGASNVYFSQVDGDDYEVHVNTFGETGSGTTSSNTLIAKAQKELITAVTIGTDGYEISSILKEGKYSMLLIECEYGLFLFSGNVSPKENCVISSNVNIVSKIVSSVAYQEAFFTIENIITYTSDESIESDTTTLYFNYKDVGQVYANKSAVQIKIYGI